MKRHNLLTHPGIAALYTQVPARELEKFATFLESFPYRFVTLDGVEWAYVTGEGSGEAVLILPGALGAPEVSWKTIAALAERYRVISPEYPPVKSMDALADGIAAILRREGVARAHVLGGSYGGLVAQVFVRRHPETTRSLVLSHTLPPDPDSSARARNMMRWLALLPEGVLLWLMGRRLGGLLPEQTPETAALYATVQEMLRFRLTKADLLALMWRTVDFTRREYTPGDLADWPGGALLVLAADDPSTPANLRARLQALYPDAKMHLFHGSGHAASVTRQAEYLAVIDRFLQEQ